jgi:hypothetical protein
MRFRQSVQVRVNKVLLWRARNSGGTDVAKGREINEALNACSITVPQVQQVALHHLSSGFRKIGHEFRDMPGWRSRARLLFGFRWDRHPACPSKMVGEVEVAAPSDRAGPECVTVFAKGYI